MRSAAKRNAASVSPSHDRAAAAISAGEIRIVAGVSSSRSKRLVQSMRAASPRRRTASIISSTTASTSAAASRFAPAKAANSAAKRDESVRSLSGIDGVPETIDPSRDFVCPGLERRAIDDEARGHLGDAFDLDQAVRLERGAGLDEVDDLPAEPEA